MDPMEPGERRIAALDAHARTRGGTTPLRIMHFARSTPRRAPAAGTQGNESPKRKYDAQCGTDRTVPRTASYSASKGDLHQVGRYTGIEVVRTGDGGARLRDPPAREGSADAGQRCQRPSRPHGWPGSHGKCTQWAHYHHVAQSVRHAAASRHRGALDRCRSGHCAVGLCPAAHAAIPQAQPDEHLPAQHTNEQLERGRGTPYSRRPRTQLDLSCNSTRQKADVPHPKRASLIGAPKTLPLTMAARSTRQGPERAPRRGQRSNDARTGPGRADWPESACAHAEVLDVHDNWVSDDAGTLDRDEFGAINGLCNKLHAAHGVELAVAISGKLNQSHVQEFSTKLFNSQRRNAGKYCVLIVLSAILGPG